MNDILQTAYALFVLSQQRTSLSPCLWILLDIYMILLLVISGTCSIFASCTKASLHIHQKTAKKRQAAVSGTPIWILSSTAVMPSKSKSLSMASTTSTLTTAKIITFGWTGYLWGASLSQAICGVSSCNQAASATFSSPQKSKDVFFHQRKNQYTCIQEHCCWGTPSNCFACLPEWVRTNAHLADINYLELGQQTCCSPVTSEEGTCRCSVVMNYFFSIGIWNPGWRFSGAWFQSWCKMLPKSLMKLINIEFYRQKSRTFWTNLSFTFDPPSLKTARLKLKNETICRASWGHQIPLHPMPKKKHQKIEETG